jgi:L-asparaginase / beta-aspartyl-peptidase
LETNSYAPNEAYRNFVSPRRFKFAGLILAFTAWTLSTPVGAQESKGWQSEPLQTVSNDSKPDAQQIDDVLLKMLERWNAHDIEGYMDVYWNSSDLLVIVDSEQFSGWRQLHDSYVNGYPNKNDMGYLQPVRIQIKILKPDFALALTWWSLSFPSSAQKVVGTSTMNLEKFDIGWKIVTSHTSVSGM